MATFIWVPDHGATEAVEARTYIARFGDGYSQRVPQGINNLDVQRELSFTNRPKKEVDDIDAFLREHKGTIPFDYWPVGESSGRYVCEKWKKVRAADLNSSLTATFEKVP
jgi:phage-related protein